MAAVYLGIKQLFATSAQSWLPWAIALLVSIVFIVAAALLMPWQTFIAALKNPDTFARKICVWITASLLAFAMACALFYLAESRFPDKAPNAATVFSVFWAISIAILILFLIPSLPDVKPEYGVFAGIAGGVAGWGLGMYISPENTSEQEQFAKVATAVIAIFSGFTLKLAWDWFSKQENQKYRVYCGIFALSAAVATAAVYNTRAYGNKEVKITFQKEDADPRNREDALLVRSAGAPAHLDLTAAVTGVPDTSVRWQILDGVSSAAAAKTNAATTDGHFTAPDAGHYKVEAQSIYDPRLVDVISIEVK